MISKTKYHVDNATIVKLFAAAGIEGVTDIAPLGAGEYNAVYSAKAGDQEYVLKIAPDKELSVLNYEKNMMASEVFWYQQISEHTSVVVPKIYYSDYQKKLIPTDFFIMEKLPGQQMDQIEMSEQEKSEANAQMARMLAQIHKIKNDKSGYIQDKLYDNWYLAIRGMVTAVIKDAKKKGRSSRHGNKLLAFIDQYKDVLEKAECSMVNFDLWEPNIICRRENGEMKYAWIDPERSFWGDRIADFVCLEMMTPMEEKKRSLAAYNEIAENPIVVTKAEKIRYAIALSYLALIMETEKYFRYTPFHFGWWRNVAASSIMFKQAFRVLNNR